MPKFNSLLDLINDPQANKVAIKKAFRSVARELYNKNLALNIEHQRLEDILTQVAEAVFAVDEKNKVTLFNTTCEEIFKVKKDEVVGKSVDKYVKIYNAEDHKPFKIKDFAFKNNKKLNDYISDSVFIVEDKVGEKEYYKLNYRNISYDDKSKECVVSLTNITREIQIDKLKDEFISIASHELKTPISIVKTNLWMLNHLVEKDLDNNALHYIGEMQYGLQRLSKIVNNLLDISRIEQGRFVLDTKLTNLDEAINESVEYFKELAKKRDLKLIGPKEQVGDVKVDKDRFVEVLDNFLSNAIKYTNKGGIKVNAKKESGFVKITVTDTGPGINKSDIDRLFKKFSRAKEGLKQDTPGASTGLGLYITKKIVHEMGGNVGVKSTPKRGSSFWFTIPIK